MTQATPPIAQTETGQVQGLWEENDQIAVFKGIPYAAPPVGDLRWRPPQPARPWSGVLQTTEFGPFAIQYAIAFEIFVHGILEGQGWNGVKTWLLKKIMHYAPRHKESEDCLYLNVRTPSLDSNDRLPVMVWIHGGDHHDGSGGEPLYDSNALALHDRVVVSINYRLGLMGYFAHPELSAESEHHVSGNYGTLDQIAALQWVQENISAFGGDPDNVTIFGESAGGESVAHMLTSPLARGLFHKAIMQSPANGGQMRYLRERFLEYETDENYGLNFARLAGVSGESQLARLREMTADQLYAVARQDPNTGTFYPTIDGYVLPQSPFQAFYEGNQTAVPLIVGSNTDEGTIIYPMFTSPLAEYRTRPMPEGDAPDFLAEAFEDDTEQLFALYPGLKERNPETEAALVGDSLFGSKTRFYAEQSAKVTPQTYYYMFGRVPPSKKQKIGAFHAADIPFVHGKNTPVMPLSAKDHILSKAMMAYWAEFAETGDPNQHGVDNWLAFDADNPQWMYFDVDKLGMREISREEKYDIHNRRTLRLIDAMPAFTAVEAAD